jgi:RimJ/RimL family protein N-acetyltransferase
MVSLRTDRLVLRPWREDDLAPFAALNADPEVMRFFPGVLDRERSDQVAHRIAADIDERGWGLWAADIPGSAPFAGFIGLTPVDFEAPFTPAVEVGWRLARAHWGRGYAPEGARAALIYAFDTLRLSEVVSMTIPANLPSRRVMEKLGMHRDPADDFDHPRVATWEHCRHVLYRLRRSDMGGEEWAASVG